MGKNRCQNIYKIAAHADCQNGANQSKRTTTKPKTAEQQQQIDERSQKKESLGDSERRCAYYKGLNLLP